MHRGSLPGNYSNSLDDLDRELALLRQKRELLEGQQNQLRGGNQRGSRGQGGRGGRPQQGGGGGHAQGAGGGRGPQGGGGGRGQQGGGGRAQQGGGGGNVHHISPWDNNAPIQPLFSTLSDYNPQHSGGNFNYANLYEESPREQYRQPPRRNDNRKRVEPSTWNDRPNNNQNNQPRQPPRKRSRPNPPSEQQRYQNEPRMPNNNAGSDSNRSFKERSDTRGNPAPNPPASAPSRVNRRRNEQPPQFGKDDILRANTDPPPKVRGRLEHALGVLMQKMKSTFPEKDILFKDPLPCKAMKQMLRDRIKGLLLGKQVGTPNDIVLLYRESFPTDDDIIKSVDSLISTTAKKVASNFDKQVKKEDDPSATTAAAAKRGGPAKNSGPTAVKPAQTEPRGDKPQPVRNQNPRRNPEADAILGHFKENLTWAIDSELKLMFDNVKDLYKDKDDTTEGNIKEALKKIIILQRARFEEELNKPTETAQKVDESPTETANKITEAEITDTSVDKDLKAAENGEATAQNAEGDAEMVENQAEKVENQAESVEKDENQVKNVQDENEPEKNADAQAKDQVPAKQAKLNKSVSEVQRICNYVLGIWLHRQMPLILPRFREAIARLVRKSLYERVQVETGSKEVSTLPAWANVAQVADQKRYYVSLVGRPKLPKRPKLSAFLFRFNPASVKRHKSIFNLLFVGFANKEDYDNILEQGPEVTFGTCQVFIKPSKARPSDENNASLVNSTNPTDTDQITIVEDRQGTDGLTTDIKDGDDLKIEDFSEDVDNIAVKNTVAKETVVSIKDKEVANGNKVEDEKTDQEKEENFLDNMLDGAIVLDSVGDDDDDLMFVENPDPNTEIKIHIDLDETVILGDDDEKTTDGVDGKTIDGAEGKTIDGSEDKTIDVAQDKKIDGAADKTIEPLEKPVEVNDEKKADDAKQEGAGVTTRRSTRLNN